MKPIIYAERLLRYTKNYHPRVDASGKPCKSIWKRLTERTPQISDVNHDKNELVGQGEEIL